MGTQPAVPRARSQSLGCVCNAPTQRPSPPTLPAPGSLPGLLQTPPSPCPEPSLLPVKHWPLLPEGPSERAGSRRQDPRHIFQSGLRSVVPGTPLGSCPFLFPGSCSLPPCGQHRLPPGGYLQAGGGDLLLQASAPSSAGPPPAGPLTHLVAICLGFPISETGVRLAYVTGKGGDSLIP